MKTATSHFLQLLWLLGLSFNACAVIEPFSVPVITTANIVQGLQIHVEDGKFSEMDTNQNWSDDFANIHIINRISLEIDQTETTYQPNDYSVDVDLEITYFTYNDVDKRFDPTTVTQQLSIDYSVNTNYRDKQIFQFDGGNAMDIKVLSVNTVPNSAQMNLLLEATIEVERYYQFDPLFIPTVVNHNTAFVSSRGELEVNWNNIPGAEEYDLEWFHVNNLNGEGGEIAASDLIYKDRSFNFNSSRVRIKNNSYRIPLLYEQGYLLYRVRGIGRIKQDNFNSDVSGLYSGSGSNCATVACFPNKFKFDGGHEPLLNWQVTTNYAEQGKSKVAVSYFDGSLRNHQVVSKLQTDDQIIVGETIYDFQGRAAINTLPTPGTSPKIAFKPEFNKNATVPSLPYNRTHFDLDQNNLCVSSTHAMSTDSGSSRYYSAQNPIQTGHQAYLPDAKGFPFTQIEYTPDNTGRIRSQSGVGFDHILGSGHETRYFYGVPFQEELDRFFASEVGYAQHYKKNMVQDANGQLSVSYLDPQGRVIATGLTGETPLNVASLGNTPKSMTIDLLNKTNASDASGSGNSVSLANHTKSLNAEILVDSKAQRAFEYKMDGTRYEENCAVSIENADGSSEQASDEFCYDCVFDLKVSLSDQCTQEYLAGVGEDSPGNPGITTTLGQGILDQINEHDSNPFNPNNCSSNSPPKFDSNQDIVDFQGFNTPPWLTNNGTTVAQLPVGNYSLDKVLTVNQQAMDFYTNDYLGTNECLLDLDYFTDWAMAEVDLSGCEFSCEDCFTSLGDYEQYDEAVSPDCDPCLSKQQYQELIDQCKEIPSSDPGTNPECTEKTMACESAFEAMLIDMSPDGQYGKVREGNTLTNGIVTPPVVTDIDPGPFLLSIYNSGNILPRKSTHQSLGVRPYWRKPYNPAQMGAKRFNYLDSNNQIVMVTDPANGNQVRPKDLTNLEDFIALWEADWARSLIIYHPEYPYYEFCLGIEDSHQFDDDWLAIEAIADVPAYYKNPLSNDATTADDPYFNANDNPFFLATEYNAMDDAMDNYLGTQSLLESAYLINNCPGSDAACSDFQCLPIPSGYQFTDADWAVYKSLYISLKKRVQQTHANLFAIDEGGYNGCIGEENFNPLDYGFSTKPNPASMWNSPPYYFPLFNSQFYNYEQPCNWARYPYYRGKTARFPTNDQLVKGYGLDLELCSDSDPSHGEFNVADCPAQSQAIIDQGQNLTDLSLYEQCGQCPLARDLQTFLNGLAEDDLLTNGTPLSCNNDLPEFVPDLKAALNFPDGAQIDWKVTSANPSTTELQAALTDGGQNSCDLRLLFPADNSLYRFEDIESFKLLEHDPQPNQLPLVSGQNFTVKATVVIDPQDADYNANDPGQTKEIILEGLSSCLNIRDCSFDKICTTSTQASQLQILFNALLTSPKTKPGFPDFADLTEIPYSAVLTQDLIDTLDAGINQTVPGNEWIWTSEVDNGLVVAKIQRKGGKESCNISFNFPEEGIITPDNLLSFHNIRPDPDGGPGDFLITAKFLKVNEGKESYVTIKASSDCFDIGECSDDLPTSQIQGAGSQDLAGSGLLSCTNDPRAETILANLNLDAANGTLQGTNCTTTVTNACQARFVSRPENNLNSTPDPELQLCFPSYSGYLFEDIVSFSDIAPDQNNLDPNGGPTSNFIIKALLKNGETVSLTGSSGCLSVGQCTDISACNENELIENGDFEQGNSSFSNALTFNACPGNANNSCDLSPSLNDFTGTYGLAKSNRDWQCSEANFNGPSRFFLPLLDHTNPGIGKYMIVAPPHPPRGAIRPYKQIWQQDQVSVKAGRQYDFTIWFQYIVHPDLNLDLQANFPKIELALTINGDEVAITTPKNSDIGSWKQLSATWVAVDGGDVKLEIFSVGGNGCESVFGIDDISFKEICNTGNEPSSLMCDLPPGRTITPDPNACVNQLMNIASQNARTRYNEYIEEKKSEFQQTYLTQCLDVVENFNMTYQDAEHHYTLYYYDTAGNLVRTIPPEGVEKISDQTDLNQIRVDRATGSRQIFTEHTLATTYQYNSLNQLVSQSVPDHDNLFIFNVDNANPTPSIPLDHKIHTTQFRDRLNGFAFSEDPAGNGHLYLTQNGGDLWSESANIDINNLKQVQFTSANVAYAIGQQGMLIKSDNAGDRWLITMVPTHADLVDLYFSDDNNGFVFERNGTIWQTTDGSKTWNSSPNTNLSAQLTGNLTDVAFKTNHFHALSDSGQIFQSIGQTATVWNAITNIRSTDLTAVQEKDGIWWAIGVDGTLLKSIDNANHWREIPQSLSKNLIDLHVRNDLIASVLDADGIISKTLDGGLNWSPVSSASKHYQDLSFINDTDGFAVDRDSGQVIKTTNGGASWQPLTAVASVSQKMFAIDFQDNNHGFIAGEAGEIWQTTDGGTSWNKLISIPSSNSKVIDIHTPDDRLPVVITANQKLWKLDSSSTWIDKTNQIPTDNYQHFHFLDQQTGTLIGANGNINSTADGGNTWTPFPTNINATNLRDIYLVRNITLNSINGVAVGQNGAIYGFSSTNPTWIDISNQVTPPPLQAIAISDSGKHIIIGADGTALTSNDGNNWATQITNTSNNLTAVAINDNDLAVAVGENGVALRSTNAGANWSPVFDTLTTANLNTIIFAGNLILAAGDQGTFIVSVDNGVNWQIQFSTSQTQNLHALAVIPNTSNRLLAVGENSTLLKSTTAATWTPITTIHPPIIYATHQVDEQITYAVGERGHLLKTLNGGANWETMPIEVSEHLNSVAFLNANTGFAVGNNATIIATQDGGSTWNNQSLTPGIRYNDISFFDASLAVIVGDGGTLLRNTLSSVNNQWVVPNSVPLALNEDLYAVHFTQHDSGLAVGTSGRVLIATNSADDWSLGDSGVTVALKDVFSLDQVTGFAIGNDGTLLKTVTSGQTWEKRDIGSITDDLHTFNNIGDSQFYLSGQNGHVTHVRDFTNQFSTVFFYDRLGRLVASQNAKQHAQSDTTYSYTLYDPLGRIIEVGQIDTSATIEDQYDGLVLNDVKYATWIASGARSQITKTVYDNATFSIPDFTQDNLRTRVASILLDEDGDGSHEQATHYSYDIHGNVKTLIQDRPQLAGIGQQYKRLDYQYDLVSGNVKLVEYQPDKPDQFSHKYQYDADNRITQVHTSKDGVIWDQDASYSYYPHGPLARTELGDLKVQGLDYAYTIQGWLKGINSNTLMPDRDIGKDGAVGSLHQLVARDEVGFTLGYFNGDYSAINSPQGITHFEATLNGSDLQNSIREQGLYNGNISNMVTAIGALMPNGTPPQAMSYEYDQLNRLKQATMFNNLDMASNQWLADGSQGSDYQVKLSYDANGNIKTLSRNAIDLGSGSNKMDELKYVYETIDSGYKRDTNKLRAAQDSAPDQAAFDDIKQGQIADSVDPENDNYQYDQIGNLIADAQEEIDNIDWTVYGKVEAVERIASSDKPDLAFGYDANGNRVTKIVKNKNLDGTLKPESEWKTTHYVRDASGNVMSTYQQKPAGEGGEYVLLEQMLYGSSRLGLQNRGLDLASATVGDVSERVLGEKQFELSNHLGNVLATVSDRALAVDGDGDGVVEGYLADVGSYGDYYAFGMGMFGRGVVGGRYRYGFNGMERDNEIKGQGNSYDFGARLYDSRIGRWLAIDPERRKYAYFSPYLGIGNSPIKFVDPNGGDLFVSGEPNQENQALLDIRSLVPPEYRQAITITEDNEIIIDRCFDWPTDAEINSGKGLGIDGDGAGYASFELINNLIRAKEKILFQVADKAKYYKSSGGILNKSTTARYPTKKTALIIDGEGKVVGVKEGYLTGYYSNKKPVGNTGEEYDGVVTIAKTGGWLRNGKLLSRSEVAFHELYENYERTVNKLPYRVPLFNAKGLVTFGSLLDTEPKWDSSQFFGAHYNAIKAALYSTSSISGSSTGLGSADRTLEQTSPQE